MVKGTSMDQELELEPEIVKLLTYVKEKKIVSWDELVDILGQDYVASQKMETVLKILEENEVKVVMSEDSDDDDTLDDEDALDDEASEDDVDVEKASEGSEGSEINKNDWRYSIRPKNAPADPSFFPKEYYQVYKQRTGFLPNLSILDLLFNEGPQAILTLRDCFLLPI